MVTHILNVEVLKLILHCIHLTDITSNDIKLPELFEGANQDPWYWLLSLIQLINRNISIAISGLDCMVRISEFELDKQSLCNSYITSNGLCSDGIAKGIFVFTCVHCKIQLIVVFIL